MNKSKVISFYDTQKKSFINHIVSNVFFIRIEIIKNVLTQNC